MPQLLTKEQAQQYENKWIAILLDEHQVVGSGNDAAEAINEAEHNGHPDAVLYKVLPLTSYYVPASHETRLLQRTQ
jgi:hypothetical protein